MPSLKSIGQFYMAGLCYYKHKEITEYLQIYQLSFYLPNPAFKNFFWGGGNKSGQLNIKG